MTTPVAWFLSLVIAASAARADVKPAAERRLHLGQVEASSYLVNDWNRFQENYVPLYVGDDDPKTAWNDGVEGSPAGQWLRMHVTTLPGTTRVRLRVRNGYQKTNRLFAANARLRGATVLLLPSNVKKDVELTDTSGWQDLIVEQPEGPLEAVELRVGSVYEGKKYDDLAISDVQLHVTSTTPDNPAFEKSRFDKILQWKRDRLAAAQLFKTTSAKALPIAAQYVVRDAAERAAGEDDAACDDDPACLIAQPLGPAGKTPAFQKHAAAHALAQKLAQGKFATMSPVKAVAQIGRAVPKVDGLCTPSLEVCSEDPCTQSLPMPLGGQLAFLKAGEVGTLTAKDAPTLTQVMNNQAPGCQTKKGAKFAWAQHAPAAAGAPGRLEALLLAECALIPGREGYFPYSTAQLLVYDDKGRLELSSASSQAAVYEWREGAAGPVLAGGWQTGVFGEAKIEEAVAVARR
jgi:hypothetical protein